MPSLFCNRHAVLGKHEVRRGRGDNDQVDGLRVDARRFDRVHATRQLREVAGRDIGLREMTCMDARAGHDPLVARLDALLRQTFSQILIGDAVRPADSCRYRARGNKIAIEPLCLRGLRSVGLGRLACDGVAD